MIPDGTTKVRFGAWVAAFLAMVASAAASADGADLAKLSWLGGCWQSVGAESGSGEQWTMPAGGAMLGIGRSIKQGKMMTYEFLQIRTLENGVLAYIAQPSGQNSAAFPVLQLTDNEVVFQNLEHDFPQRIIYRLEGATKLAARIEGSQKGTLRAIDFPMERISCEAPIH
jgi:hypothetical protein